MNFEWTDTLSPPELQPYRFYEYLTTRKENTVTNEQKLKAIENVLLEVGLYLSYQATGETYAYENVKEEVPGLLLRFVKQARAYLDDIRRADPDKLQKTCPDRSALHTFGVDGALLDLKSEAKRLASTGQRRRTKP